MPDVSLLAALVGGLLILAFAGDFLINGAVTLCRRFGVSPLVAGIFIVGFGTSAPELLVAASAAASGYPDLALGNVVGSNIANVWLVLSLPALIAPVVTGGFGQKRAFTAMLIATAAWITIFATGGLTPTIGFAFLAGLAGYAAYTFVSAAAAARSGVDVGLDDTPPQRPVWRALLFVLVGVVGLQLGANLIIEGGVGVARFYSIPEEVIGLTLLAIGTSLPEIGAGIAAALRGRTTLLVGNVLGSNIFNILGAGGIVAFFGPVEAAPTFLNYDHWAMAAAALTAGFFILTRAKVSRLAAVAMLLTYAIYISGLISGWNITGLLDGG